MYPDIELDLKIKLPDFGAVSQIDIYRSSRLHRWLACFFSGKNFKEEHLFDVDLEEDWLRSRFGQNVIIKRHYKYSGN